MDATSTYRMLKSGNPEDTGTLRFRYSALLAGDRLAEVVAYGRALGLVVDDHRGGGWLVRRGWIVAKGRRRMLATWYLFVIEMIDFEKD